MSGSKREKELTSGGEKVLNKRELARLEEAKKKKKTQRTAIIIIVICALLLAAALVMNSNFARRHGRAFSVDDMDVTPAEFTFHYYNYYYDYLEYVYTEAYEYVSVLLPDTTQSLEAQMYDDTTTWKDHFQEYCEENLKKDVALYKQGKSVGFEMSEEQQRKYDDQVAGVESSATATGYSSVDKYLSHYYGPACTYEILKEQLAFLYYAESYEEYYKDSISFTDEEILDKYEERKDYYDSFEYRYFIVYPEDIDEDAYETDEEKEAAEQVALQAAHARAIELVAKIDSEEDMIEAARSVDGETYAEDDSTHRKYNGELLGSTYGPWLRETDRKAGDVEVFDISVGTYIVMFLSRDDNSYLTRNVRTILITPETVNKDDYSEEEDDTAYNEAVEMAKSAAHDDIEQIRKDFEADPTEENFAQLAIDKSKSTNAADGGLWANANHDTLPDEVTEWLFDDARKEGDTEIIWGDIAGGYYLTYYIGEDMPYNLYLADKKLKDDAQLEWEEALTADMVTKRTWMYSLT